MTEDELKSIIDRRIAAVVPALEKARSARAEIDAKASKIPHLGSLFAASLVLNFVLGIALWIVA